MIRLTVTVVRTSDGAETDVWELAPKRHRDLYKLHSRIEDWLADDARLTETFEPAKAALTKELLFSSFTNITESEGVVHYLNLVSRSCGRVDLNI